MSIRDKSTLEGRLSFAIQAHNSGQLKSLRAASRTYGVPYSTLNSRVKDALPRRGTRPATCKLTALEEDVLLQRILDLDAIGFPPRTAIV